MDIYIFRNGKRDRWMRVVKTVIKCSKSFE